VRFDVSASCDRYMARICATDTWCVSQPANWPPVGAKLTRVAKGSHFIRHEVRHANLQTQSNMSELQGENRKIKAIMIRQLTVELSETRQVSVVQVDRTSLQSAVPCKVYGRRQPGRAMGCSPGLECG
jgi:hypothetical protein